MRMILGMLALWPGLALAEGWALQDDAGIRAALADRTVRYDAHTMQHFDADGHTDFITERVASGRWVARDGQYCSLWPPSGRWACYDLETNGDQVRFVGADGSISTGTYTQ